MANIMRLGGGSGGGKPKKLLSSLTEGSLVSVLEDGKLTPFYVAKHNYEADLNGEGRTLLVRKDLHSQRVWHNSNYDAYASSDIDAWLNGDYKATLSSTVLAHIGLTDFYYTPSYSNKTVTTLKRSVFIPSVTEFGFSDKNANTEGSALPIASVLSVAYLNGTAYAQWSRSPYLAAAGYVWYITFNGGNDAHPATNTYKAVRPCFTLPANMALNTEPYGDGSWGLADEANITPETYFPQLLWTNASPTSAFAAQTVTVASGYDAYLIECRAGIYNAAASIGYIPAESNNAVVASMYKGSYGPSGYSRFVTTTATGSITFSAGRSLRDDTNTYNDSGIPTRIWGVNLSL